MDIALNKQHYVNNLPLLQKVGESVNKIAAEEGIRPPVIAGGAVRDLLVGIPHKDIDVFLDVSSYETEGDKKDAVLSFIFDLADSLHEEIEEFKDCHIQLLPSEEESKYGAEGNNKSQSTYVTCYEIRKKKPDQFAEEQEKVLWHLSPPLLQVIGHDAKSLTDDPLEFVGTFDHSLVECLYDPFDQKVKYTDSFKDSLEKREIRVKGGLSQRVYDLNHKILAYSSEVFEIVSEAEKKPTPPYTYTWSIPLIQQRIILQ